MNITREDLADAIAILKASGHKNLTDMISELEQMSRKMDEDHRTTMTIIDREAYFAITLWSEDDITTALMEEGYEPSKHNIKAVTKEINAYAMQDGMIETGWEYIYDARDMAELK